MNLDPRIDRCIIWFIDKCKVQIINGTPLECINRIVKYALKSEFNERKQENMLMQWCNIRLDTSGSVGKLYAEQFKKYGIKFDIVKYVNDIL